MNKAPNWKPKVFCKNGHPRVPSNLYGRLCKTCAIQRKLVWQKRHPQQNALNRRKYCATRPERCLLADVKNRAKRNGIPFNLTLNDIVIPERCPVFGIPLIKQNGQKQSNSPSIDRLRPELGYVSGNVWIISERANRLKNNMSLAEMEMLVSAIRRKLEDALHRGKYEDPYGDLF